MLIITRLSCSVRVVLLWKVEWARHLFLYDLSKINTKIIKKWLSMQRIWVPIWIEKKITVKNTEINLALWDTAGQEKYNSLTPMYYRDAHGALLVFDIIDRESFKKVNDLWRYQNGSENSKNSQTRISKLWLWETKLTWPPFDKSQYKKP